MISAILYDEKEDELTALLRCVRDTIAMQTEDESRLDAFHEKQELIRALQKLELNDLGCLEFTEADGNAVIAQYRKRFPHSALLLVVDETISPAKYIRPAIMASSVILRPCSEKEMRGAVAEFLMSQIVPDREDDEACFRLETREGVTRIPYERVLYIEASAKKVFIRLRREEYGYYDTLDHLEQELPEYFIRCHRGYIVNAKKVQRFVGAENLLYLDGDLQVPVSRSYKGRMRELLK